MSESGKLARWRFNRERDSARHGERASPGAASDSEVNAGQVRGGLHNLTRKSTVGHREIQTQRRPRMDGYERCIRRVQEWASPLDSALWRGVRVIRSEFFF